LIHEVAPNVAVGAMLVNPNNPNAESVARNARETALSLGLQLHILNAGTAREIDTAFASIVEQRIGVLLAGADPFFLGRRDQFVALAARHAVPAIYYAREFVTAGGLMSYGTSISDAYRRAGIYTGKILKGAKPADLPVEQSTRFEFVINLKTAKTLRLTIPASNSRARRCLAVFVWLRLGGTAPSTLCRQSRPDPVSCGPRTNKSESGRPR
jgi:putative ABC transport system substrate-binding protein